MRDTWSSLALLPAVVNYKYQHGTNINFFLENKDVPEECMIPPVSPLVIIHPMTDRKVIIKNHLISRTEWERMFMLDELFFRSSPKDAAKLYTRKKNLIDQKEKKECPFHGH
jgi:hypothetical protein